MLGGSVLVRKRNLGFFGSVPVSDESDSSFTFLRGTSGISVFRSTMGSITFVMIKSSSSITMSSTMSSK